jgi:hypothetical protein
MLLAINNPLLIRTCDFLCNCKIIIHFIFINLRCGSMFDNGSLLRRRKRFKTQGQNNNKINSSKNRTNNEQEAEQGFGDLTSTTVESFNNDYDDNGEENDDDYYDHDQYDDLDVDEGDQSDDEELPHREPSSQFTREQSEPIIANTMPETDNEKLSAILFKKTGINFQPSQDCISSCKNLNTQIAPPSSYSHMLLSLAQTNNIANSSCLSPKSLSSTTSSSSSSSFSSSASSNDQNSAKNSGTFIASSKKNPFSIESLINTTVNETEVSQNVKSSLNKLNENSIQIKKSNKKKEQKTDKMSTKKLQALSDTFTDSHNYDKPSQFSYNNIHLENSSSNSSCSVSPISPIISSQPPMMMMMNQPSKHFSQYLNSNNDNNSSELAALRFRNLLHTMNFANGQKIDLNSSSTPPSSSPMSSSSPIIKNNNYEQQHFLNAMLFRAAALANSSNSANSSTNPNFNVNPAALSNLNLFNPFYVNSPPNFTSQMMSYDSSAINNQQPHFQQLLNSRGFTQLNFSNISNLLPLFLPMHG